MQVTEQVSELLSKIHQACNSRSNDGVGRSRRSKRGIRFAATESLEQRCLLTSMLSAQEQFMLELVNRARANPEAEASRLGIDLNQNLDANTISSDAKQPLAPNDLLENSAVGHSLDMLARDFFAHNSPAPNITTQSQRATSAGYTWNRIGENLALHPYSGSLDATDLTQKMHDLLFLSSGHRENLMGADYFELGIGIEFGQWTDTLNQLNGGVGTTHSVGVTTQHFGAQAQRPFITGVVFTDAANGSAGDDNFYTVGEQAGGGGTITATNVTTAAVFTTTIGVSGGYSLHVPAGTYDVVASGGNLDSDFVASGVTVAAQNVKVDFETTTASAVGGTTPTVPDPEPEVPVTPPVSVIPEVQILDNGSSGHSSSGFTNYGGGYESDLSYAARGNGSSTSTWTFTVAPGSYRVSSTWTAHSNRATDAPYAIFDGDLEVGQRDVNQEQTPNDLSDSGGVWEDIATVEITGTTLRVTLTNAANEFVIADAIRIESVGAVTPAPTPTTPPEPEVPEPTPPVITPTVPDPEVPVIPATPPVSTVPVVQILDNGSSGHSSTGFTNYGGGYESDLGYAARGNGSSTSTWTFTVAPGSYRVSSTWTAHSNRATDAPYAIFDGDSEVGQRDVNQEQTPNDLSDSGGVWEDIATVEITGTTLRVTLTNAANEFVIADAIRIESVGAVMPTPAPPEPEVPEPTPPVTTPTVPDPEVPVIPATPPVSTVPVVQILDNGSSGHSSTGFTNYGGGYESDLGYAARGNGSSTSTWTFTVAPGSYRVSSTWTAHSNRATDAPYAIFDGDLEVGQRDVNQEQTPNDLSDSGGVWEDIATVEITGTTLRVTLTNAANEFVIADAIRIESVGAVTPTPAPTESEVPEPTPPVTEPEPIPDPPPTTTPFLAVIDNGSSGFASSEFVRWSSGYEGDLAYSAGDSTGGSASWTFADLVPGTTFEVSATWVPYSNRATDAPFTVSGVTAPATTAVNQRLAPSDFSSSGVYWRVLGAYTVDTSGQLTVSLSDSANGYVIADAVRIQSLTSALNATHHAPSGTNDLSLSPLEATDVEQLIDQAIAFWSQQGIASEELESLHSVNVQVANLPGTVLGLAGTNTIYLDQDAAGFGWSLDGTDAGRIDLGHVIAHEIGHLLGYDHDSGHGVTDSEVAPVDGSSGHHEDVDELFSHTSWGHDH